LSEATLHIGETGELGEKKYEIVFLVLMLLEYATACNAKVCLTIRRSLNIGYKEPNIPANPWFHKLDKNSFHIWPREYMLIALPNLDGSYLYLFMPFEGENSFASLEDRGDVALFLKRTFQTL
jgi:kynurenine 3-monooxygenase